VLHDQVNDWTSARDFREQITWDALLYPFGGIASIAHNSEGKPVNLFRLNPEQAVIDVTIDPFEGSRSDRLSTGYRIQRDRGDVHERRAAPEH
jgi:hypothetical protein